MYMNKINIVQSFEASSVIAISRNGGQNWQCMFCLFYLLGYNFEQ